MTDPKPGERFEYRGLTWEPWPDANGRVKWRAEYRECVMLIVAEPMFGVFAAHVSSGLSHASVTDLSAKDALDWTIRACPEARCGTCRHFDSRFEPFVCAHPEVSPPDTIINPRTPADGYCHRWSAKP